MLTGLTFPRRVIFESGLALLKDWTSGGRRQVRSTSFVHLVESSEAIRSKAEGKLSCFSVFVRVAVGANVETGVKSAFGRPETTAAEWKNIKAHDSKEKTVKRMKGR
mmetsp:Transcript_53285/g.91568  ORF Transcript_53285/g.91568 Transcript_53285/m.91568 type:complete len:107 (+) Transcript_53285:575-895(+)